MAETFRDFSGLPINPDDLIHARSVESNRIEFKSTWDHNIKRAVVRTICAFANDLLNLNGGYVVLGIEESEGRPVLPPRGLATHDLDKLQIEVGGACKRIRPEYHPLVFPLVLEGKQLVAIWAPGGDNRPYEAPEDVEDRRSVFEYYVRQGPQTVVARGAVKQQLLEVAAKVPFDDRRTQQARIEDISSTLVRRFLFDVRSRIVEDGSDFEDREIYRRLRITTQVNAHEVPRNVGLLFFNQDPEAFFAGARIDVVQFGDPGGDLMEERTFRGPLPQQIKDTLEYLDSLGGTLIRKVPRQAEVERTVPYPYEAMEEAIVNAIYHRGYDGPPEPTKVYLYSDRMEIISYPGPMASLLPEHFQRGSVVPPVPARNRRVGELLKELRLAEARGTGVPKIQRTMRENGSPEAIFEFDEPRSFFRVILPVHPHYQILTTLREADRLRTIGDREGARSLLEKSYASQPESGSLASQIIELAFADDDLELARRTLDSFEPQSMKREASKPYLTMARLLLDRDQLRDAMEVLGRVPPTASVEETMDAAILRKRAKDFAGAHRLFAEVYALEPNDPKILHEFAQTKLRLAGLHRTDLQTKKRLDREAAELLRRAIQLTEDPTRQAWAWIDLANALEHLRQPPSEVEASYLKARALLPHQPEFVQWYEAWKQRSSARRR